MVGSRRSPKNPRRVAEGTGKALREKLGKPPEGSFADGVQAHVEYRRMCPESEPGCDLGPYVEPNGENGDHPAHLGGKTSTIRFPAFFHDWFSRQTPKRLATLDELIDERHDRAVLRKFWSRTWKLGVWLVPLAWSAMYFAADKITKTIEQLPVIRGVWKAIMGKA